MNGFAPFVSATADGAASQNYFINSGKDVSRQMTGRAFFRLSNPETGTRRFRLWFSNALDSTYGQGMTVLANAFCEGWDLLSACVWTVPDPVRDAETARRVRKRNAVTLTFDGSPSFRVEPGMVFACDPFDLPLRREHTFAFELTFRGHILPCHTETVLPVLRKEKTGWTANVNMPLPVLIGTAREDVRTLGFLGDSITQGIQSGGPDCAFPSLVQKALGPDTAVWNLGIGYARAADAATNGFWVHRAKQCDTVCVCLGVNDIAQGFSAEAVCSNLKKTVLALRENGCTVYLLTPPPFNFSGDAGSVWDEVCYYCEEELKHFVRAVLPTDRFLSLSPAERRKARYGAHPNAEGHRLLADAVVRMLKESGFSPKA